MQRPIQRLVAGSALVLVAGGSLVAWLVVGLPNGAPPLPFASKPSDGAATARLIQERTAARAAQQQAAAQNLQQHTGSGAPAEQPTGILYLGYRYIAHEVTVVLDRVEFYAGATTTYCTVINDSDGAVTLDPGTSTLHQQPASKLAPMSVSAHSQAQLVAHFPAIDTHRPFDLELGFTRDQMRWSAHLSVDPQAVISSGSTKPR